MRLQIFSDLHVDVSARKPIKIADGVDAVICAGDVCEGVDKAFRVLRGFIPETTPILFVMGNHESYRRCLPDEISLARALARGFNVLFLSDDVVELGGVRFAGCSLWTDYRYFGAGNAAAAMAHAARGMNDHRLISWSKKPWLRFRPEEALSLHAASKAFLEATLATPFAGSSVVISHHGLAGSVHSQYKSDPLTPAFVSDLSEFIGRHQPDLWVHGHVHNSCDYQVGKTRIICNPHGYGNENPDFNPQLIVEVGS
jgi:Icc-related predicted phosphoesterase